MQKKEIIAKCKEVESLLSAYNIISSFNILSSLIEERKDYLLQDELNRLRQTYRYMTEFLINGGMDPDRETVYADLIEDVRSICDRLVRDVESVDSPDSYSEALRYHRLSGKNINDLIDHFSAVSSEFSLAEAAGHGLSEISKRLEEIQSEIFNTIWVSLYDKNLIRSVVETIKSGKFGEDFSCHIISALTLSLFSFYDRNKLEALLDIYEAEISESIAARSLIGIVLTLAKYPERVNKSKRLLTRLSLLEDSLMTYRRLREIVMTMIRTRDTDRVANKMKEEVLPELMKLRPDIMKKMREGMEESIESGFSENNPEWEEMLEKSGLTEKMRELSDMQSEGADLMMVAFSNLKQFPFFHSVSNWFLPFRTSHSAIRAGEKERMIIENIMEIGRGVCDSDKYSLAIALGMMPEAQKEMMRSQIDAQFSQMSEEIKEKMLQTSTPEFDEETTKVIRDFYRFFKLFRKKNGFYDPFARPFNFLELPVLGDMMADSEILSLVGEFYFNRGYYQEALSLFSYLSEENGDDPALWEKIGYCYQSFKFFDKALEAYTRAELLKTPGSWLLNKLAFVNRRLGNYSTALEYYKRLLEKEPENPKLLLNAGFCALEEDRPDEALQFYYHADYVDPERIPTYRAIAWCEFLRKDFEKSEKYYGKILQASPLPSDWLNLGHLNFVKGDLREAIVCYKKAAAENMGDFEEAFCSDIELLLKSGIEPLLPYIVLDAVRER